MGTAGTKAHKEKIQNVHKGLKDHVKGPLAPRSVIIIVKGTHCIHSQRGK